jgi:hypothetical protein
MTTQLTTNQIQALEDKIYRCLMEGQDDMGEMGNCREAANSIVIEWMAKYRIEEADNPKGWGNSLDEEFESKADAFDWLNKTPVNVDYLRLYCDGEVRYTKTAFGIFDEYDQIYIKGLLPVERYEKLPKP